MPLLKCVLARWRPDVVSMSRVSQLTVILEAGVVVSGVIWDVRCPNYGTLIPSSDPGEFGITRKETLGSRFGFLCFFALLSRPHVESF